MKTRISKKLYSSLPAPVADAIRQQVNRHVGIKSLTLRDVPATEKFYLSEGTTITAINPETGESRSVETVAEHNIGAANVNMHVNANGSFPAGVYVIGVYYYGAYHMNLYRVREALPALV